MQLQNNSLVVALEIVGKRDLSLHEAAAGGQVES